MPENTVPKPPRPIVPSSLYSLWNSRGPSIDFLLLVEQSVSLVKLKILFNFIVILSQLPIFRKATSSGLKTILIFVLALNFYAKNDNNV